MNKKGQITVFIIIGLIILAAIGTVLYLTSSETVKRFEAVRPQVAEIPAELQPVRDLVTNCIEILAKDGLRRIGDSGGYVDGSYVRANFFSPTEGDGVQLAPGTEPTIAYWWYMKSANKCESECEFGSKRPPLYRQDGSLSIETQLDDYIKKRLPDCLNNFEEIKNCKISALSEPVITTSVAQDDVFFVGKYKLRAICGEQTYDLEDYYVNLDVNFREMYQIAFNITNYQAQYQMLEQVTKNVIDSFSALDEEMIPPSRDLQIGMFVPPQFWIKTQVKDKIKEVLAAYIPLLQSYGTRNYNFRSAPAGTRDDELYELIYNGEFNVPLLEAHPTIETRYVYLDWWDPYLYLGCKGQVCSADSANAIVSMLFITINRYNFPLDLSYPVMVELRNPDALDGEGYAFKFMLEQNMRNSEPFASDTVQIQGMKTNIKPSLFCNPEQRTVENVSITVKDVVTLAGIDEASVSYSCGSELCHLGETENGKIVTNFPQCVGGIFRVSKVGYIPFGDLLDVTDDDSFNLDIKMFPETSLTATVKNYALMKTGKRTSWEYQLGAPLTPQNSQRTYVQLERKIERYEDPYFTMTIIDGDAASPIRLVPGNYTVTINSFLTQDIIIPVDKRCIKYKKLFSKKKKCFNVPSEPIRFNETKPFPYGAAEFDWEVKPSDLAGKKNIEFRQFVLAIDKVAEQNRIVEDLEQIETVNLYAKSEEERLKPVIT